MLNLKKYITTLTAAALVLGGMQSLAAATHSKGSGYQKADVLKVPSNDSNFNKILSSKKVVIVDFYAEWCNPCRRFLPVFEQVAREMKGSVTFVKVNVDHLPNIRKKYQAASIPTIILFKDGKEIERRVGGCDAKTLKAFINTAL